ncbi:multidrug DMT transporter [Azospirillum cavernae]|uniref:Multidrug DMT transporter n=1 Tax=Azospirillum cavernae TaxID=2320860 RepID=A0A418VWY9_9PROT|nr:DNA circularization N-terminal domain-containing protein [Azospirillum cavernae]RJF81650.1 multidrug DMT transporter [Azospirillum cavernae]
MPNRNAYQALGGALDRVTNAAGRLGVDLAGFDGGAGPWHTRLQTASFRGVPFGVIGSASEFGRRVAVHEYPYRDSVWVEDLGRGPRRISLIGFLVEGSVQYGGGDVLAQRDRLVRACETAGEAELVHPTLGRKSVALLRFHVVERRREGRVFEITLDCVEAGKLQFPEGGATSVGQIEAAADAVGAAAVLDFVQTVGGLLKQGSAILRQIVSAVGVYVRAVFRLIDDATNLYNAVRDLPGAFGRFIGGTKVQGRRRGATTAFPATLPALKAATAARRATVAQAGADAMAQANALTAASLPTAAASVAALVSAAARATPNATDALRLLTPLASFSPVSPVSSGTVGSGAAPSGPSPSPTPAATATATLVRRAALAEVARAAARYEPPSHDQAVETRSRVVELIDAEMTRAGDAGQDQTYQALRALRTAVSVDLTERGASLTRRVVVSTARPQPALVLAQRLYQDPARSDELVEQSGAIHPAFLPVSFNALAE